MYVSGFSKEHMTNCYLQGRNSGAGAEAFAHVRTPYTNDFLMGQSTKLAAGEEYVLPVHHKKNCPNLPPSKEKLEAAGSCLPPSASTSLDTELTDGAGETAREGTAEGARLCEADVDADSACLFRVVLLEADSLALRSRPTRVKLSLFPVPNLFQG